MFVYGVPSGFSACVATQVMDASQVNDAPRREQVEPNLEPAPKLVAGRRILRERVLHPAQDVQIALVEANLAFDRRQLRASGPSATGVGAMINPSRRCVWASRWPRGNARTVAEDGLVVATLRHTEWSASTSA